ncbi:MAG: YHS domain-containing (seleno)protein [Cellvibrionaceae bacterium]
MKKSSKKIGPLFMSLALGALGQIAFAADPDIYSHKKHGAIKGADPVAYFSLNPGDDAVIGDKNISFHHKGADWFFSSEENRDLFRKSPEKYTPQFGGYCAFAVSHGFTKSVNPDYWHVVDDKLYLNYNFFADRKWRKNQKAAIDRGNDNWPLVLKSCEEHNNCLD